MSERSIGWDGLIAQAQQRGAGAARVEKNRGRSEDEGATILRL